MCALDVSITTILACASTTKAKQLTTALGFAVRRILEPSRKGVAVREDAQTEGCYVMSAYMLLFMRLSSPRVIILW
jgi:hypothetical protein